MARKVISLSLDESLLREIEKYLDGGNRNKFIVQAVRDAMHKPVENELSVKEKIEKIETDASLGKMLDDGLLSAIKEKQRGGESVFSELTGLELAKLAAQRIPKNKNADEELEEDYLSLTNILKRLPSVDDVTAELNKLKGENFKFKNELEIQAKIIKMQNRRLKKEHDGADEPIRRIMGEFMAMAKNVKDEFDARGLKYEGMNLNGNKQ